MLQVLEARARQCADREDRLGSAEKGTAQEILHLQPHHVERVAVHEVRLGQHRNAAADRQKTADVEMLPRLRLDGFIRRDHQQHQVDARDSSQHVAHKTLMAGNVHEAQSQGFAPGQGQLQMGKPEVDGDAAALFFLQAIGVDSGQRFHQSGFSVINVPGGAYDH